MPRFLRTGLKKSAADGVDGELGALAFPFEKEGLLECDWRIDQKGMVPAVEILLCTAAVRNIIREARTFEIPNVIDTNRAIGMCSLDGSIAELYFNGMISKEDAIAQAAFPDKLERQLVA